MLRRDLLIVALAAGALPAACRSPLPPPRAFPDPSFRQDGLLTLDVAEIEVVGAYRSPQAAPNVEHLFPVPPERMLRRWAAERLAGTGTPGLRARFIIEDASVRESEIARQTGLRAAFTNQQAQLYEGSLRVTIEITDAVSLQRLGLAAAETTRTQSVAEKASVADREAAWAELAVAMMTALNAELERQIRTGLRAFLR